MVSLMHIPIHALHSLAVKTRLDVCNTEHCCSYEFGTLMGDMFTRMLLYRVTPEGGKAVEAPTAAKAWAQVIDPDDPHPHTCPKWAPHVSAGQTCGPGRHPSPPGR